MLVQYGCGLTEFMVEDVLRVTIKEGFQLGGVIRHDPGGTSFEG